MPSLNRLAAHFASENLEVVPVSIDISGVGAVRSFYERMDLDNLPIYMDPSKDIMRSLRVFGIPTTVLIDTTGQEIGRFSGAAQWDAPAFVTWLAKAMANEQSHQIDAPSSGPTRSNSVDAVDQEFPLIFLP